MYNFLCLLHLFAAMIAVYTFIWTTYETETWTCVDAKGRLTDKIDFLSLSIHRGTKSWEKSHPNLSEHYTTLRGAADRSPLFAFSPITYQYIW